MKKISGSFTISREAQARFREPDQYEGFVRATIAERLVGEIMERQLYDLAVIDSPEETTYTFSLHVLEASDFAPPKAWHSQVFTLAEARELIRSKVEQGYLQDYVPPRPDFGTSPPPVVSFVVKKDGIPEHRSVVLNPVFDDAKLVMAFAVVDETKKIYICTPEPQGWQR